MLSWGGLPRTYRDRDCQGAAWKRAFPAASSQEIRAFLAAFTEAFAFAEADDLRFAPQDSILGVYRSLYPSRWMPDQLELETLATTLRKRHGVLLADIWREELSLGDVFARVLDATGTTQAR